MERLYYYCFSFIDSNGFSSCYKGLVSNNISLCDIEEAKKDSCANKDAVMIAVSYLGYMSKNEVRNI